MSLVGSRNRAFFHARTVALGAFRMSCCRRQVQVGHNTRDFQRARRHGSTANHGPARFCSKAPLRAPQAPANNPKQLNGECAAVGGGCQGKAASHTGAATYVTQGSKGGFPLAKLHVVRQDALIILHQASVVQQLRHAAMGRNEVERCRLVQRLQVVTEEGLELSTKRGGILRLHLHVFVPVLQRRHLVQEYLRQPRAQDCALGGGLLNTRGHVS